MDSRLGLTLLMATILTLQRNIQHVVKHKR